MKILFFSDSFAPPTATFIYNDVIGLAKKHDVKYLCTIRENAERFPFQNVEVVPYKINKILGKFRQYLERYDIRISYKNSDFAIKIKKIIEEFKPDLIHCHFAYEALKISDNYKSDKIPIVISMHGYDASALLRKVCYKKRIRTIFKRKNINVIFSSEFMKKRLEHEGVRFNNLDILYYGVNTDYFKRKKYIPVNDKFIFLQISSFAEKKGHFYTLYAFKKFLEEYKPNLNFKLIFSGGDDNFRNIKALVNQLGLENNVEFPGWVTTEQVKALMDNAHAFVHHSITARDGDQEGIPNAIIEAMAMELPVISTWHAGIPELVEDGVNGYLVQERDIESYARRMRDILSWGYLKVNRQKIIEKFEINKHLEQLEEYYKIILGK